MPPTGDEDEPVPVVVSVPRVAAPGLPKVTVGQPQAVRAPVKQLFVSEATAEFYRRFWPAGPRRLTRIKDQVHFYNDETIPRLYQVWDEGTAGGILPAAGANNEFPWRDPAGTVAGSNFKTIRFVRLNDPITWWRGRYTDGRFARYRWEYAGGTLFGEILLVTDPQGFDHTCEVRLRERRDDGTWMVNAYRPFVHAEDLDAALRQRELRMPEPAQQLRSLNSGHGRNGFQATARQESLPQLAATLTADLLDHTAFQDAKGERWNDPVIAPTSDEPFSLVPRGWLGGFVPVSNTSCMNCHRDAGTVVNLTGDRRWRLRGDDGIFSFHVFSPDSSGTHARLNNRLVQAGLLAHAEGAP